MNRKHNPIAELGPGCGGAPLHPHYLGYFACFNRGRFHAAHDVLEALWLPARQSPNGSFYKGLIQLAGAFVHLQKNRPGPAVALFQLARRHLEPYPARHEALDVPCVLRCIDESLVHLRAGASPAAVLALGDGPRLPVPVASEAGPPRDDSLRSATAGRPASAT